MAEKLKLPSQWGRNRSSVSQVRWLMFNVGIWHMFPDLERFPLVFNFSKRVILQCFVCLSCCPQWTPRLMQTMKRAVFCCCNGILNYFSVEAVHSFSILSVYNQPYRTVLLGQGCTTKRHSPLSGICHPIHHSSLLIMYADPVSEVIWSYNKAESYFEDKFSLHAWVQYPGLKLHFTSLKSFSKAPLIPY